MTICIKSSGGYGAQYCHDKAQVGLADPVKLRDKSQIDMKVYGKTWAQIEGKCKSCKQYNRHNKNRPGGVHCNLSAESHCVK